MKGNYFGSFLESHAKKIKMLGLYLSITLFVFCGLLIFMNSEWEKRKAAVPTASTQTISPRTTDVQAANAEMTDTQITKAQTTDVQTTNTQTKNAQTNSQTNAQRMNQGSTQGQAVSASVQPAIRDIDWPVRGEILQGVGISYSRTFSDYRYHSGLDIKVKRGADVAADLDGRVGQVETSKGEGKKIVIEHGSGWQSIYSHLTEVYVKTNDVVSAGKRLGMVGQPGLNEILDEPHLHFELRKDGKVVDPLDYLPK